MRSLRWTIIWTAVGLSAACGGREAARAAAPESAPPAAAPASAESAGSVAFELDGEARSFDFLDPEENVYMPIASSIVAHPESGATERLSISFISFDIGAVDYPADLPAAAKDLSSRAMVGFGYIDSSGADWNGAGTLHVESLATDGTLTATFDEIRLAGAGNSQRTLSHGVVTARIASP